ncbi:hypothetical protein ACFOZ7_14895 [Natribaculum luteum]|uniref:Uncharacterized protein n=1 Tax=Natribaculum luteum TaxID=1586232 RepID=A0ABD5P2E6_9EURY|nr:hypothetical protein [Natribaculum luteum]
MSTRNLPTQTESTPESPANERLSTPMADRSPTDRSPATFSYGQTNRLQNLIDEWNAAFVDRDRDRA